MQNKIAFFVQTVDHKKSEKADWSRELNSSVIRRHKSAFLVTFLNDVFQYGSFKNKVQ